MVNDKRTFGDYIGQWRRVMEKGLPNAAQITVRTDAHAIYDPIEHKSVPIAGLTVVVFAIGAGVSKHAAMVAIWAYSI